jgi:hypothetical protein
MFREQGDHFRIKSTSGISRPSFQQTMQDFQREKIRSNVSKEINIHDGPHGSPLSPINGRMDTDPDAFQFPPGSGVSTGKKNEIDFKQSGSFVDEDFMNCYKVKQLGQYLLTLVMLACAGLTYALPQFTFLPFGISITILSINFIFGITVFATTLGIITAEPPAFINTEALKNKLQKISGVIKVDRCEIFSLTDKHFVALIAIKARSDETIYSSVKNKCRSLGVVNVYLDVVKMFGKGTTEKRRKWYDYQVFDAASFL